MIYPSSPFYRIIHFFSQDNFKFELWQILLSLSITAGSSAFILYQNITSGFLTLHNFNDRTIGIVIFSATDATHRTELYVGIWIFAFLIFCILLLLLACVNRNYLKTIIIDFEKELFLYLSLMSIASLFLYALSQQQILITSYKILLVVIALVGIIILIKYYISIQRKNEDNPEFFSDPSLIILSFLVPYCCIFCYWIFVDPVFSFSDIHLILYCIIWAVFVAGYYCVFNFFGQSVSYQDILKEGLIKSIIPLLLIPLTVPLSNELQYSISGSYPIPPNDITKFLVLFLIGVSICIFWLTLKRQTKSDDLFTYVKNYYFPLILISIGLLQYYHHFLNMGTYDIFHHGELLISSQQLFVFHNIPFVNIFPTHGFLEMFYQILYSSVNGYSPVQSLLWNWIPLLIAMVLLYFLLSKLTIPLFAILISIFFPIFSILSNSEQYLFCLLPVFTLIWLMKKPDFFRFCIHWALILFLFLWRLDFGAATFAGTVFIFAVLIIKKIIYVPDTGPADFKIMTKSFIFVFGMVFIGYCILLFLSDQNILHTILVNIQMCTYQAPVQAYAIFYNNLSFNVILEYVLFPIIALIFVISFVFDQVIRNHDHRETQLILAFLAVITLALSIRSVQRHSMVEGFNAILFPLLLILLPLNFEIRKKQIQHVAIVVLFLIYMIVVPSFAMILPAEKTKFFEYHNWTTKENRIIDDQSSYQNLKGLITNTLGPKETFYDFSNAPLIYVFTNKEFIPYLIPNIYQSSEINQINTIEKLDKKYQQGLVPLVIFKQGNWWDHVDNVPNEIRSYRIAEYIYQHYRPIGYIDNKYEIWVADNVDEARILQFENQPGFTTYPINHQYYDLQKLPYIWGTYDPLNAVSKTRILENVTDTSFIMEKGMVYPFSIAPDIDKSSGNYLYLQMKGSQASIITITYGETGAEGFTFSTEPTSKDENYLVRVSTQWDWMNTPVDKISITSSENIELSEMNIRKGD
jgi:hypothetical protein